MKREIAPFKGMVWQLVDSELESTRIYWRETFLGFSYEQARDPRPAQEIIHNR